MFLIGSYKFSEDSQEDIMVFKLRLNLYEAGKGPRTILTDLVPGDKLSVGRGQNVQLWVNDKNISREHCQISNENNKVIVTDLKSRNGTFINGQRILKRTEVKEGDEIRLASTSQIVVFFENVKEPVKPDVPMSKPRHNYEDKIAQEATVKVASATKGLASILPKEFSLTGEEFNGYKVESKLGSGGMAVVYKGTHLALNRPVAIKTLSKRLIQNPKAIKRFLNVAKISGQLNHPNIVQIYDSGKLDQYGIYYIVMEYAKGESLDKLLDEGTQLSIDETCNIIGYIASALKYANKRNIIHRDINPSNILVGKESVPKLIGLGLAKCLDDEMTALTQPGKGMGMVGYVAPEQLMDATKADHRSDIYSLGAIFYRCLCGRTHYDTKNMREYFNCIRNKIAPIPPYEINNQVPRAISDIITKSLEYDPERRYQNSEEFLEDLRAYMTPTVNKEGFEKARKQILAMLPSRTSVPNFEFESIYKPAEEIGGDFYDFIEFENGEIGIVIADVTGHGVEAAVVVGMVKAAIKIMGKQHESTAEALHKVNKEIYPDLDTTTFATVFYGIINRETNILRFTRAGHNPLIIYNPNRPQPLTVHEPKGMVIGMFSQCSCEEAEIQLQSGDCIIQYTDGITEAMNTEQEEFGMQRLCQIIEQSGKDGDIKKILSDVEIALKDFMGVEEQQDDITMIIIRLL